MFVFCHSHAGIIRCFVHTEYNWYDAYAWTEGYRQLASLTVQVFRHTQRERILHAFASQNWLIT